MNTLFDELVTHACEDRTMNAADFRLFSAIVRVYRRDPAQCNHSQRQWGKLAGMAYGRIGKVIARLERLGYIRTTEHRYRGYPVLTITVLSNGKPISAVWTPKWEIIQSHELPPESSEDTSRYRVTIEEWQGQNGRQHVGVATV